MKSTRPAPPEPKSSEKKSPSILPGRPKIPADLALDRGKQLGGPIAPEARHVDSPIEADMRAFIAYARRCSDEKGDAQVFCDRLFRAFGHPGYKEAGAVLENRVKMTDGKTRFADLVWKPRVLIEMKKRGEKLGRHYGQAMQYWLHLTPNRPRYVMLCNFDEFWIYDFNTQLDEPMDRLTLDELQARYTALNFLFPEEHEPLFRNNRAAVTDVAAMKIGELYRTLVERGETRERAQRFTLQCVVSMFSEDTGLLPRGLFTELVVDCMKGKSSYDLLGALFSQMNRSEPARAGRFKGVRYFNGGIFATIDPIELNPAELLTLHGACDEDWSRINPAIFGKLFQESMGSAERHRKGAHYTPEAEIMRVVLPTIIAPWQERIQRADSVKELLQIRDELTKLRVLDPACGSGNFLYVAYRELKRLELRIIERVHEEYKEPSRLKAGAATTIQIKQFFGIDNDPFAVELAKVTMVLAKKLALDEANTSTEDKSLGLFNNPLPLENLDLNVVCADALFCEWPEADVVVGNPPFLGAKKIRPELGRQYVARLRKRYPEVPGMADYCVWWIRKTHDHLADCTPEKPMRGRAGLVGTQNIRNNKSRSGLDYVCGTGTIVEAVDNQPWPGEANVHVSIVNWVKHPAGETELNALHVPEKRKLWYEVKKLKAAEPKARRPRGAAALPKPYELAFRLAPFINSALSDNPDVSGAVPLSCNDGFCYTGQYPRHAGFMLKPEAARAMIAADKRNATVVHSFLAGKELLTKGQPIRYVIDLQGTTLSEAKTFKAPFRHLAATALPHIQALADKERDETGKSTGQDQDWLQRWWQHFRPRTELIDKLGTLSRFIVCSRVTQRPIFVFVSPKIRPGDALSCFAFEDDYSFGILQSDAHWRWFTEKGSKLEARARYTPESVFDTFPWPQSPSKADVKAVAKAAREVRVQRFRAGAHTRKGGLRAIYQTLDMPGSDPLRDAHHALDAAVTAAYGFSKSENVLSSVLALNLECVARVKRGEKIRGPGLPPGCAAEDFTTPDCIEPPDATGASATTRPKGRSYSIPEPEMLVAAETVDPKLRRP